MNNNSHFSSCQLVESGTTPIDSIPNGAIFFSSAKVASCEDLPNLNQLPEEKRVITEHIDFSSKD